MCPWTIHRQTRHDKSCACTYCYCAGLSFYFTTHAQLFLLFLLLLLSSSHYFLFSSHTITTFLLYFSSFSFTIHTKQQGDKIVISYLDEAHYSYCRRDGPATFSETFSSQQSSKNASGAPAVIRHSVNTSKLHSLELAVHLKQGTGIGLGSGLGVTGTLSGSGEGSSIS